jgi:hypothetical protein
LVKGGYVVRENDDRIIIRFAGIIAVPMILWTITALIVGLPKVLTFHSPLATASINEPERATNAEPTQQQSTPRQAKLADPQEAKATELLVQHLPDAPPSAPSAAQIADTPEALATISTPMVAKGDRGLLPPSAANDGATAVTTGATQSTAATEAEADALSASAPLSGTIPLPRPRPHGAGTVDTVDMLSRVPMPRPRSAAGGSGAQ